MRALSVEELGVFCEQLAMILRSGLPVAEGLSIMKEELEEGLYKDILIEMEKMLEEGISIPIVFQQTGVFPNYMIQMVKVGFEAGKLDEVMKGLHDYYEKEAFMRQQVKRVLFYPMVLLGLMSTVILVITTQVIPIFEDIIENLGMEMSGMAISVMHIGEVFAKISIALLLIGLMAGVVGYVLSRTKKGKKSISAILEHSKLYEKIFVGRFLLAIAMMLSNGVEPIYAVELANDLVEHKGVKKTIESVIYKMQTNNQSFVQACGEEKFFSNLNYRMLVIGERTGCVDETLLKLAKNYEEEAELGLESVLARIEPAMVIILAGVVGSILISVMFPLIGVMSAIG